MNWECKYCKSNIILNNKNSKTLHLYRCKSWKEWKSKFLTKDFLYKEYIEKEKSLPEIAADMCLDSVCVIHKLLKKYKIKTRSVKQAYPKAIIKVKKTNLIKYGSESILYKDHPKRIEIQKNILKKYNVTNVFQLESVKNKSKETNLRKYGTEYIHNAPEIRQKYINTMMDRYGVESSVVLMKAQQTVTYSKIHRKVYEYLISKNFLAKNEKLLKFNNSMYFFDIYFENIENKLIEINGDYYHASPLKYTADSYISKCKLYAKQIWDKDLKKLNLAKSIGYDILVLWEHEINKNFPFVEEKILRFLNENRKD
jgi:hypothetical protein